MPFAAGDEQVLVNRLREASALSISLVCEYEGRIVGHIAFSLASAIDGIQGWYALGPVSVEPEIQHQGIGTKLINRGIVMLKARNGAGCVLIGSPTYYARFGFRPFPDLAPEGEPAEYFQILPMRIAEPNAVVCFHPLFHTDLQ